MRAEASPLIHDDELAPDESDRCRPGVCEMAVIDPNLPVVNVGFAAPAAQELLLRVAYIFR
jgi:hypothetical protein